MPPLVRTHNTRNSLDIDMTRGEELTGPLPSSLPYLHESSKATPIPFTYVPPLPPKKSPKKVHTVSKAQERAARQVFQLPLLTPINLTAIPQQVPLSTLSLQNTSIEHPPSNSSQINPLPSDPSQYPPPSDHINTYNPTDHPPPPSPSDPLPEDTSFPPDNYRYTDDYYRFRPHDYNEPPRGYNDYPGLGEDRPTYDNGYPNEYNDPPVDPPSWEDQKVCNLPLFHLSPLFCSFFSIFKRLPPPLMIN